MMRTDRDAFGANGSGGRDGIREIPKWARRYAQNRALPMLVFQAIFVLGACAFGGLAYLGGWAYVHGHRGVAAAAVVLLSALGVWWLWFSVFQADRTIRSISARLYQREGQVAGGPYLGRWQGRPPLVAWAFGFCVVASVGLGFVGVIPQRYMQPVSAIYVVPFMLYIGLKLRRVGSPLMMLWPALYSVHAALIVAGAPISRGPLFDMFVPTVGYGTLAALISHVYSRIALRKLRALGAVPTSERDAADDSDEH